MIEKTDQIRRLRELLLAWGDSNRQVYPWRDQSDPYAVLVAEFMLQRTQASQVVPVYNRFLNTYPSLEAFTIASPTELQALLYPLGLQWRLRGMIKALQQLWELYRSVPTDIKQLLVIPGIGPYIAGATVCYSTNRPTTLIDTNTVRVTGRVFGMDIQGEARRRPGMISAITEACDPLRPRDYYLSMIDLAHTVCRFKKQYCEQCPLRNVPCGFFQQRVLS